MLLTSRISAVTIFLDRAKVTRTAAAKLPAGETVLQIDNIPTSVNAESVRVKGRGAAVRILSIDVPLVHLPQTPDGNVAELQNQLEQLELRQKEIVDLQAIQEQKLKMIGAMRVSASTDLVRGLSRGKSGIEQMEALSVYADREEAAARSEIRILGVQNKAISKEIEALRARLKQLHQPAMVQRRSIQVTVEASAAETEFALEATYVCTGATWHPLYDVRLTGDRVQVTYLASLTQNTGENWDDVELSLSTARTAVTTSIPELEPWYLNVYAPPPPRAMMASMARPAVGGSAESTGMFEAPAAPAMAAPAPMPQAVAMQADVQQEGASATFRIPRRTSIPSDRTPHRAQIAEFELDATLDYVTAPKAAEQAYLRATVRNDSNFVLLPGAANLFHGEEFVGATQIEDTAAREFELQMGVDERLTVTRELVSREVSKAFIGNTRKTVYAYKIRIAHRLESSKKIIVIDQLPHSRHEEIKVKLLDASPKPSEQSDLSELKWKATLEPGKDLIVNFSFSVEYPRTLNILGLQE